MSYHVSRIILLAPLRQLELATDNS